MGWCVTHQTKILEKQWVTTTHVVMCVFFIFPRVYIGSLKWFLNGKSYIFLLISIFKKKEIHHLNSF